MDFFDSIKLVMHQQQLVGEKFYELFFGRHPEFQQHFDGVDMRRQVHLVTMALLLIQQFQTHGYPATENYLRYLGTRHNDRSIAPETFPAWRDAMLATLEGVHGDQWEAGLQQQWKQAIDEAIDVMMDGYQTRVTV